MNIPSLCPACSNILVISQMFLNSTTYTLLSCNISPEHHFECYHIPSSNHIQTIDLKISNSLRAHWYFDNQILTIYQGTNRPNFIPPISFQIPWFIPNLQNYTNLISKIKTYTTFF